MRTQQQPGSGRTGDSQQSSQAPRNARPPVSGAAPPALLGLQRSAGNAATSRAVQRARNGSARPALPVVPEEEFELPSYLMNLQAGGLSSTYGLTGHEFVRHAVSAVVGHADGTVADIAGELTGRPESFFGQGRAFAVEGRTGKEWWNITVAISRAPDDRPPVFLQNDLADAAPETDGVPRARLADPVGKDTKLDVHHNTAATVSSQGGGNSSHGAGGLAFGLAPVVPGLWLGGAGMVNAQPWQSSRESRHQRNVAEPRVLRSKDGTVEVRRRVRFEVRAKLHGSTEDAQTYQDSGALSQRVPTEHLVPVGIAAPAPPRPVSADAARNVSLADSLAPVAVADTAAPHEGGGGLFDAVASVLHPSLTAPGAPGRSRLYQATSTATVLEDMPRLLRDGVVGEDLHSKDDKTAGSYHLRAAITGLSPAWGTGETQLRTHQQSQTSVTESAGKGRSVAGGVGPAIGVGAVAGAAIVRGTAMPVAAARKARFTTTEQSVASRQGAEIRGEKALYVGTVVFTVEGTGPRSAEAILHPETRVARHSMNVWISLRADEAASFGLPLPPGMTAEDFVKKPKRVDENGEEQEVERHLPYDGKGAGVALSRVDTGPMVRAVREMFATDPRLAGYLPAFGTAAPAGHVSNEEDEGRRHYYRELMTALSETNLRVNKDQLLSTGIRVRLRRKTTMHSHDVQLLVMGRLSDTAYEGDIKDWSVRSHAGVTGNAQSGRSSQRSIGGLVLGQARIVPGVLTGSARYERHSTGAHRNQAGTTGRTDVVANGSDTAGVFRAALQLDVEATMTSRPRKLARGLTPGRPGRDVPEAETVTYMNMGSQNVRLTTPTEFTVDQEGKDRLDAVVGGRGEPAPATADVAAEGIGDLATLVPQPATGSLVRDWQLVETVEAAPVRELAFALLSKAAARNKTMREDPALATEGLAPRQAIEERFGERAVQAALRQAASSGWVVKNLRYPRRLAALKGAVGTRLALANPRFVHKGAGPGTETFVLGGHQSAGQVGEGTTSTWQFGVMGSEQGSFWRAGQGLTGTRTSSEGDARSQAVSGTVERNAHTPKKAPLYLVQCDVLVDMIAEVKVTGGGPYVAKGAQTLPAAAGVWLTEAQLPAEIRRELGLDAPAPAPASPAAREESRAESSLMGADRVAAGTTAGASSSAPPAGTGPSLRRELPLGFGMIEDLPDFVPLLGRLRARLVANRRQDLADDLLPRRQLDDRNDNVQRLLRVLDRDGSAGLLSSAMDGGVTVELFDGRKTPYWAVFKVDRVGDGTFLGEAGDKRDMEYITSAVAQQADSRDEGVVTGVEGIVAGAGKPEAGAGQLKSTGGAGGLGLASGTSRRSGAVSRGQLGMKTVAEAGAAPSSKMRVPVRASLELYRGNSRVGLALLDNLALTHRVLNADLEALSHVELPAQDVALVARGSSRDDGSVGLDVWRAGGVRLPLEAQVNGFQGAPQVRQLVTAAVRQAGGGDRFRDKGQAAAYALNEAVSTEWMISALPLLTSAGVDLPPVHASGAEGQNLNASLHARLRNGLVLGVGDKMSFETIGQSDLDAPRPTQADGQSSTDHSRAARPMFGAGVLNADQFRLNQLMGNTGGSGGATDATANSSGSMPVHKPKTKSVLVQFTLDVRVVAQVTNRVRNGRTSTAVRETTLARPVVVRMPEPVVRRMLATQGNQLSVRRTPRVSPPAPTRP
ncbi:hypothetical protein QQY66_20605 [Streptomyces sp. DG2A-72]|uniref:hypothetical protein n=1 Tax=Streptomyces sp. DG2A-72 TaxID=3051386 RepID=UPI00265BD1FE|nr:hypothetical protein [Streptomyces sp. DG2A-72]MDO0933967.1 hypothetical protein [Streptomyces sp. DG2A-72]